MILPFGLEMQLEALAAQAAPGAAYAGIGSRETPPQVLEMLTQIAHRFRSKGLILRSGGAPGADQAFEAGAGFAKEIYLPWRQFSGSSSPLYKLPPAALDRACRFHPLGEGLRGKPGLHKLMARNCQQVLGAHLSSPCAFVVCWTKDGADGSARRPTTRETGGTGQAIRIAAAYGVPVLNVRLYEPDSRAAAAERHRGGEAVH